jgi:DNA polymerase I
MFGSSVAVELAPEIAEAPVSFDTIATTNHTYHNADSEEKINELLNLLSSCTEFAFDTETTSLDAHQAELVSASFSWKEHEAWFIAFPAARAEAQALADRFKPVFEDEKICKIGQNLKYDITVLKNYNIRVKGKFFDTMVAHFLINPDMRHNMNVLSETYLKYSPISIEELIGKKGKGQLTMRDVPSHLLTDYSAEDADVTYRLKNIFAPMLEKAGLTKLFEEIEIPLINVLADMEREGINLSVTSLNQLSSELGQSISDVEALIQKDAGTPFNISSPKQVGDVLFEILQIAEKPKKTKTGQYATSEDILAKLVNKHPIVNRILDYRELQKLKNTYVDTLPELINPDTKRIHTTYNQVVAVTGRLSSDNPNLQNIPIRTEKGREVRKAFIPRSDEFVLLSADYSQIELRIIAELSKDEGMIEAFVKGQDIHAATASKVYNVPLEEVTSDMRRNAKMVNFGIVYGISAFGLSERLNIPRKEAAAIIDSYFEKYPGVKSYMDKSIESARSLGYVETIKGRKRHLRDINSGNATVRGFAERNAINAPIQGSAADMIKIAMINIHKDLSEGNYKSRMLLQVHDELVFDVHPDEVDRLKAMVEDRMKNAISMTVPIEVGMGTGRTWLEAH